MSDDSCTASTIRTVCSKIPLIILGVVASVAMILGTGNAVLALLRAYNITLDFEFLGLLGGQFLVGCVAAPLVFIVYGLFMMLLVKIEG